MVPYNPAQEKKPLTPDELQRLYSYNHAVKPYAAAPTYSATPQYSAPYQYTPSIYPSLATVSQMTPPIIGPAMAPQLPPRNTPTQQLNYHAPPVIPPRSSVPSSVVSMPQSSSMSTTSSKYDGEVQLRRKPKSEKNPSGDLIDLDNGLDE